MTKEYPLSVNKISMSFSKMFMISLSKSIANFIAFLLDHSGNSVSITSAIKFIYFEPILAGIVTLTN